MRWLLVQGGTARQPPIKRVISSARTLREARHAALAWLARHPAEQRCLAFDTRSPDRAPTPINRPKRRSVA